MKTHRLLLALSAVPLALAASPALAQVTAGAPEACYTLDGARIIHDNGSYLGKIAGPYDPESIFNEYREYGSPYRNTIWNEYREYGSPYRQSSAFHPTTRTPPMIVKGGKLLGYLTVNKSLRGAIHPVMLGITCYDITPPR
ncbi:hypothetical protein [Erythrobacter aureus]|uniref:Uncharacterized protein n=1 Tax=Erythrobacter aureus TaxID=2182384 RepID=A0A345YIV3_9SPHN|nr:hypothetical protein [Erythrobacter aureus]AXK43855.1 hypothetical protein DVR09_15485 [Erythrobacter aureus]